MLVEAQLFDTITIQSEIIVLCGKKTQNSIVPEIKKLENIVEVIGKFMESSKLSKSVNMEL